MYRTYTLVVETDDPSITGVELDQLIAGEVERLHDDLTHAAYGAIREHAVSLHLSIGELHVGYVHTPEKTERNTTS